MFVNVCNENTRLVQLFVVFNGYVIVNVFLNNILVYIQNIESVGMEISG